jgi:LPXTG-motif cell wall-anchored protein
LELVGSGSSSSSTITARITKNNVSIKVGASDNNYNVTVSKIEETPSENANGDSDENLKTNLYGTYTVSDTDGWKKTITNLPKTGKNADGVKVYYSYYVEENPVAGYDSTCNHGTKGSAVSMGKIKIENRKNNEVFTSLTVNKSWINSSGEKIENPEESKITFLLYRVSTPTSGTKEEKGVEQVSSYSIYASDGWTTTLTDLPANKIENGVVTAEYSYYVEETTRLEDYDSTCNFGDINNTTIDSETAITIQNKRKAVYELPETGGNGTLPYAAGGVLLALSVGILLYRRKLIVK